MSQMELTGSQNLREEEIQNYWLTFQPQTGKMNNLLYSAPLGQRIKPDFIIHSGSNFTNSGSIEFRKEIHLFDSEESAVQFIKLVGEENVVLIKEIFDEERKWIEVHQINPPVVFFNFEILNFDEKNGYKIEIYKSSSLGLTPCKRKEIEGVETFDNSYLNFFDVEVDR